MLRSSFDQGRFNELEPIAVVDIGSNSVRLVIYEGAVRVPYPIYNEKVLCSLGRSLVPGGDLDPASVASALHALRRFRALIRNSGAKNVHPIATAAVRDAANGAEFIAEASAALGTPISVLSGEREAELAANGIKMGFIDPDGIVGDLGGGSLELIDMAHAQVKDARTLPLGSLRLMGRNKRRPNRLTSIVDEDLAKVPWLERGRGRTFFAIGGTWRALAKLHMDEVNAPLRVMHGYKVRRSEMIAFCDKFQKPRQLAEIRGYDSIARSRRETLPYGALVLKRLLETVRPKQVMLSIFGIREGLLYSYLSPSERAKDPLLAFCEDFARLRSRSTSYAYELCKWTDHVFERAGVDETPDERRLRHCVCMVSDIEWRAQADHRGEQANYVMAHAPSTGTDHAGRQFLALTLYFRHAGRGETRGDELSGQLRASLNEHMLDRARLVAAAIRLAHMFSIGMPGIINEIVVDVSGRLLSLLLPRAYADLDGERPQRRLRALGERLGLETRLVIVE
ncbi:MAG: exopolyphosphatase [Hyphomicrobiaceae bacterium]